mmetsp:Transcript_57788/g.154070  ORF Transcript_57788/g.154070 Transcript_57788/m.154070 type:complete len:291 (-) Transcript_57788:699-1571(-)
MFSRSAPVAFRSFAKRGWLNCRAQENCRRAIWDESREFTKFATTPMADPFPRNSTPTDLSPNWWQSGELAPVARRSASQGTRRPHLLSSTCCSTDLASQPKRRRTPRSSALFKRSSWRSPIPMWQKSLSPPKVPPGGSNTLAPQASRSCLHHSQRCKRLMRPNASAAERFSTTNTSLPSSANSKAARMPQGPAPTTTTWRCFRGASAYSGRLARASNRDHTERARQGKPSRRSKRRYGNSTSDPASPQRVMSSLKARRVVATQSALRKQLNTSLIVSEEGSPLMQPSEKL